MATTSVHFPKGFVEQLDRIAARSGVSRNHLIVQACRQIVEEDNGDWPPDFFTNDHLDGVELAALHASAEEFWRSIERTRLSRERDPF